MPATRRPRTRSTFTEPSRPTWSAVLSATKPGIVGDAPSIVGLADRGQARPSCTAQIGDRCTPVHVRADCWGAEEVTRRQLRDCIGQQPRPDPYRGVDRPHDDVSDGAGSELERRVPGQERHHVPGDGAIGRAGLDRRGCRHRSSRGDRTRDVARDRRRADVFGLFVDLDHDLLGNDRGGGRPTHGPPVHELRATAHGRDHEDSGCSMASACGTADNRVGR